MDRLVSKISKVSLNKSEKINPNDVERSSDVDDLRSPVTNNKAESKTENKIKNENAKDKNPTLQNKAPKRNLPIFNVTDTEKDGGLLKESESDSSNDDDVETESTKAKRQYHEQKFVKELEDYDQLRKKSKEKEIKNKSPEEDYFVPIKNEKNKFTLNFSKLSPRPSDNLSTSPRTLAVGTEPRITPRAPTLTDLGADSNSSNIVSPRARTSNAPKFIRNLTQRFSMVNDNHSEQSGGASFTVMPTEMTSTLINSFWKFDGKKGKPDFEKIPAKVLNKLAVLYFKIKNNDTYKNKSANDQQVYLRRELGRRLIGDLVAEAGPDFDNAILGSPEKMKSYLKKTYGIAIDESIKEKNSEEVHDDSEKSRNSKKSYSHKPDFLDLLQTHLDQRLGPSYKTKISLDINSFSSHQSIFFESQKASQFVKNFQNEKVEDVTNQQEAVSKTFVRDFDNSVYLVEKSDGTRETLKSVDEFIEKIGDSTNSKLLYLVSHFANQNLPIFLKNIFFARTAEDGSPDSVLKLGDGTSLSISSSFKSTYVIVKKPDGGITLRYTGVVDTKDIPEGKNTATLINADGNTKGVIIKGGKAVWSLAVEFDAKGAWELKNPTLEAEGWSSVNIVD